MNDFISTLCDKLIRRHPHVFGDLEIKTSDQQIENWEKIKKMEKGDERPSALSGVPAHLPALMKAHKISEKASRVGFDWEHADQVFAKVMEELHEFEEAWAGGNPTRMEDELGDLLFAIANLGRFLTINPEEALRKTITRFEKRFKFVETELINRGIPMQNATLEEMDVLWEEAKRAECANKF
jgi:tetrapyrrole methylase family protein/MazG family protein